MKRNTKVCPICNKEISYSNFQRHYKSCSCKYNPDKGKYKLQHDGLVCQFCGKECKNRNSLCNHERLCKENPNRQNSIHEGFNSVGSVPWNKGLTKETDSRVLQYSVKNHYTNRGRYGIPHTEETKEKLRYLAIQNLSVLDGVVRTRYNPNACRYIDQLNEKYNWNLQHAESGGEVCIGGYFLDGYDKDLNIAFEYDESRHYSDVVGNKLKEKDIQRMNCIIQKTGCRFFRYNEKIDLFYEVTSQEDK